MNCELGELARPLSTGRPDSSAGGRGREALPAAAPGPARPRPRQERLQDGPGPTSGKTCRLRARARKGGAFSALTAARAPAAPAAAERSRSCRCCPSRSAGQSAPPGSARRRGRARGPRQGQRPLPPAARVAAGAGRRRGRRGAAGRRPAAGRPAAPTPALGAPPPPAAPTTARAPPPRARRRRRPWSRRDGWAGAGRGRSGRLPGRCLLSCLHGNKERAERRTQAPGCRLRCQRGGRRETMARKGEASAPPYGKRPCSGERRSGRSCEESWIPCHPPAYSRSGSGVQPAARVGFPGQMLGTCVGVMRAPGSRSPRRRRCSSLPALRLARLEEGGTAGLGEGSRRAQRWGRAGREPPPPLPAAEQVLCGRFVRARRRSPSWEGGGCGSRPAEGPRAGRRAAGAALSEGPGRWERGARLVGAGAAGPGGPWYRDLAAGARCAGGPGREGSGVLGWGLGALRP